MFGQGFDHNAEQEIVVAHKMTKQLWEVHSNKSNWNRAFHINVENKPGVPQIFNFLIIHIAEKDKGSDLSVLI